MLALFIYVNNHMDIKFPHAKLQQLLEETGFIPSGYSSMLDF